MNLDILIKNGISSNDHIWKSLEEPILRLRLSRDLCDIYDEVKNYYRHHPSLKNSENKIKQIDNLISNLNNTDYKNRIIIECQDIYQGENKGFYKKINRANVLPFTNGVLELDTLIFRDGKPDDAMTMSTNIEYIKYDPDNISSTMKDIFKFLEDILPDKPVREYLLNVSALCLTKHTKNHHMWILTGGGSNGKSIYSDLLANVLGDFSITGVTSLITRKSEKANEANEALSSLNGARHVIFNEPGEKEIIQVDKIKVMCGGKDKISTRGCYEKQNTFIPVVKPMMLCNSIPKLSEDNYATWRRIRLIHFPMKFCEDPDPNDKYEKLVDDTLEEKSDIWKNYFAAYLVYLLNDLSKNNFSIIEPKEVMKETNEYKEINDEWFSFRNKYIIKDVDSYIQLSDLKDNFNDWHNDTFESFVAGKDIKAYFTKHLKGFHQTKRQNINIYGYLGYKLKRYIKNEKI